jgi:TolB-like protein
MVPPPAPDIVLAALDRIAASEPFANAGRLTRLLRYVVERSLKGEGDQLKEYAVGIDVFDRSADYDPRTDSIVRVEARRLRAKLEDYYRGAGADDSIVIDVPRGGYAAVFSVRASASPVMKSAADATPATRRSAGWWPAAVLLGAAVLALLVLASRSRTEAVPSAAADDAPSIAVLPFEAFSSDEADLLLAAHLTDAVTVAIAKRGAVSVASRTSAARFAASDLSEGQIASALGVEFVMEASAVTSGADVRVEARLVDTARDRKVWVRSYDGRRERVEELAARIAGDAVSALLERAAVR